MNGRRPQLGVRTFRIADDERPGPNWRGDDLPRAMPHSAVDLARIEFASLVVRRTTGTDRRVAVIAEHGRPALLNCSERLFDLYSKDHPIVGVYASGCRVRDVIDDLKAAGL